MRINNNNVEKKNLRLTTTIIMRKSFFRINIPKSISKILYCQMRQSKFPKTVSCRKEDGCISLLSAIQRMVLAHNPKE